MWKEGTIFCTEATFHLISSLSLESVLEATGWTDVLRVEVENECVYEDRTGISNDLIPALDATRDLYLHGRTSYTVNLGREIGPWVYVSRVSVNALGIRWQKCARDRRLDPGPEETAQAHHQRIAQWLEEGYLPMTLEALQAQMRQDLRAAEAAGLPLNPRSVKGPWLLILGEDPTDEFGPLFRLFNKGDISPAPNRVLLDLIGGGVGSPPIDVRVDHLDTTQKLHEFRDALVMLSTPLTPLTYDEHGALDGSP